jgi:hypothetical protein
MNSPYVDQHPQYFHSQCVSVDRIEYEIGRRGYFRHPRLGKLHANTVSRRGMYLAVAVWTLITLVVFAWGNLRGTAWQSLAMRQALRITVLQTQLQAASVNQSQLTQCIATMEHMRVTLGQMEGAAAVQAQQNNPQAANILRLVQVLKTGL